MSHSYRRKHTLVFANFSPLETKEVSPSTHHLLIPFRNLARKKKIIVISIWQCWMNCTWCMSEICVFICLRGISGQGVTNEETYGLNTEALQFYYHLRWKGLFRRPERIMALFHKFIQCKLTLEHDQEATSNSELTWCTHGSWSWTDNIFV